MTVAKWRKRATVEDLKTGPKVPHSNLDRGKKARSLRSGDTLLPIEDCHPADHQHS